MYMWKNRSGFQKSNIGIFSYGIFYHIAWMEESVHSDSEKLTPKEVKHILNINSFISETFWLTYVKPT